MMIYLIGSLRNPEIPKLTKRLMDEGLDVFSEWAAASEDADDCWRDYEKLLGFSYIEALKRPSAQHIFMFDKKYLEKADTVILAAPAGRSGHLELGWALGQGKKGYYLLDNVDRWDVMLQFCTGIFDNLDDLIKELKK